MAGRCHGPPVRVLWIARRRAQRRPVRPGDGRRRSRPASTRDGRIAHWQSDIWEPAARLAAGHASAPRLLAACQREPAVAEPMSVNPPMASGGGAERNAVPVYACDGVQVRVHRLTAIAAAHVVAALARRARQRVRDRVVHRRAAPTLANDDPLSSSPRHLRRCARRRVLRCGASSAVGWRARPPARAPASACALARYKGDGAPGAPWSRACRGRTATCACTHLVPQRSTSARVVNPDGVRNQIEGGAVQATSWALKERVGFDAAGVTSADLGELPDPAFQRRARRVHVHVLDRPDEPAARRRRGGAGPDRGGDRQCPRACARRAGARPADDLRPRRAGDRRLTCPPTLTLGERPA